MSQLNKYNTIEDVQSNKVLKKLYKKTKVLFRRMCAGKRSPECVFCGKSHRKPNFLSCKSCKQPNLLIKYGFVDSNKDSRYVRKF